MYESPINIIQGEMQMQLEGEVYKAIQRVGVDVNKEELLKALQYDREQYKKGFNDAIDEFAEKLKAELNKRLDEPAYQHNGEDYYTGICSAESIVYEITEKMKGET